MVLTMKAWHAKTQPYIDDMETLLATNNIVTISFAQAVLKEAGIDCVVFDQHSSIIEGSIGIIPKRLMVLGEDFVAARRALTLAGIEDELAPLR